MHTERVHYTTVQDGPAIDSQVEPLRQIEPMTDTVQHLHRQLVVSCQAWPNDPMDDTQTLRRLAQSALSAGAGGLRVNGPEHVRAMRPDTAFPIIAIQKSYHAGKLRITPDFASAAALADAGADIIALDCTNQPHTHGEPWREIVDRIHQQLGLMVMADIATLQEGIAAAKAGVDLIGTTLHGYTADTQGSHGFNWELLRSLARETGRPIVAEGHISTPQQAARALEEGAWCVVVGSAITRPESITTGFVEAMRTAKPSPPSESHVIGVDLGGTTIKAAVVNQRGQATHAIRIPTLAAGGREPISRAMLEAVEATRLAAGNADIVIDAIGIASAGAIDAANGLVFAATENLPGWAGFDIRRFLTGQIPLPVSVENDAHAAALAELHFGAGRGLSSFVAITLGTGVGGGIVLNGKLQRGAFGFAGTIGHQTIRFDGRPCNCGRRGCLEAYVSTAALIHEYARAQPSGTAPSPVEIAALAQAGDPAATAAYDALAGYLAEGLANLFNILDPEAIIVSGGLIEGQPDFLPKVQQAVASLLHFGSKRPPKILPAQSGAFAGVQGAAAAAFDGLASAAQE